MGVLVKICGVNSVESADAAVRASADFVGLVCHPQSPRHLPTEQVRALAGRLRGRTRLVALLCDQADDAIASVIENVRPDLLQLHGRETPERVSQIRSRFGVEVMKAIQVADATDAENARSFCPVVDMLLFDAKPPRTAARSGGHGVAFDWQILRGRSFTRPWLLAGGLSAENVARALEISGAPGVDVSSGVERGGIKDGLLIEEFVAHARGGKSTVERCQ